MVTRLVAGQTATVLQLPAQPMTASAAESPSAPLTLAEQKREHTTKW